MRSNEDRLRDMLEAVKKIEERLPSSPDEFTRSEMLVVWTLYHIQIIGEAANGISPAFQESHPAIPWKDVVAMRHLLVHQYFGIDLDEVWSTAHHDIPKLGTEIRRILKNE